MNSTKFLKFLVFAGLAALLGALASAVLRPTLPPAPPFQDYGSAPSFKLIDQRNREFDSAGLRGKVWVASFVYTSCKESCPMLAAQMKRLTEGMPESGDFRLVSVSVDPEKDTPERLARYAKDLGVEDPRWSFLTGKKSGIRDLVIKGFKLAVEKDKSDVLHSSKLVLVDKQGRVRGYFDGLLGESAEQIRSAALQLLKQP